MLSDYNEDEEEGSKLLNSGSGAKRNSLGGGPGAPTMSTMGSSTAGTGLDT